MYHSLIELPLPLTYFFLTGISPGTGASAATSFHGLGRRETLVFWSPRDAKAGREPVEAVGIDDSITSVVMLSLCSFTWIIIIMMPT